MFISTYFSHNHLPKSWPVLLNHLGPGGIVGIATGYGLDGPGVESRWGARFSAPLQTGPGVHPASCTIGTGSFPEVKSDQGVTLTPHPLLVSCSWKDRAVPLFPRYAVHPVQSLNPCTRMHFTLPFLNHPVDSGLLYTHHPLAFRPVMR
jgi:hypothetical protein